MDEELVMLEKNVAIKRTAHKEMDVLSKKGRRRTKIEKQHRAAHLFTHAQYPVSFEFQPKKNPTQTGGDTVQFVSANKNTPLQPVAEIASGGEISWLMLSLKQ